jgi:hypothetical protein
MTATPSIDLSGWKSGAVHSAALCLRAFQRVCLVLHNPCAIAGGQSRSLTVHRGHGAVPFHAMYVVADGVSRAPYSLQGQRGAGPGEVGLS